MLFKVSHVTSYRFSVPVYLEPHVLRLRPRCDASQALYEYRLEISPEPAGQSEGPDAEGNPATFLWFNDLTPSLEIVSEAVVETLRTNPFDYLLAWEETGRLPAAYPPEDEGALGPYRQPAGSGAVSALAAELVSGAGGDTLGFLNALNGHLYGNWKVVVREEGDPLGPEETLGREEGSCRDLAVLFMELCREAGLAARFVSGYQQGDPVQATRYMHAWPEVYLPGAGWRGYDPTLGLVVSDRHVALAAAAYPAGAAPTSGTFRGTGAESTMSFNLAIDTVE